MGAFERSQGQRARSHFRRGAGGLRQGALTLDIQYVPESSPDLSWDWQAIVEGQRGGKDPLREWRDQLAVSTARQYAAVVPSSMPSAFVLQWALEVAAEVGVHAARHHSWIVHPEQSGLSFALQPTQLYPVAAQFRRRTVTPALLDDRLVAARAAYRTAGIELALGYRSDARLGERTRLAMVDDVWAMTIARARGQRPPQRGSCCFIYVLPGVHECSGCPRLAGPTS